LAGFEEASLTFQYLGLDALMAGGLDAEGRLAVHRWDGNEWTRLETVVDADQNYASAGMPGPGLYALTVGVLAPQVTSVSPGSGDEGQVHTLTVSGENFLRPLQVTLRGDGVVSRPLTVTSVTSRTMVVETPADLPPDLYDLELTNAGGLTAALPGAFALHTQPETNPCFYDDFKSGLGKWDASGEWATVTLPGGEEVATDSPVYPYLGPTPPAVSRTTALTSQVFNLARCSELTLTLRHDYELLAGDWVTVELSADDGATWHPLVGYTGQAARGSASVLEDEEWKHVDWQTVEIDLAQSGVATGTTTARLRFKLVVDDLGAARGWVIDEVSVGRSLVPDRPVQIYLPIVFR
jgi:hypothetical protein